MRMRAWSGDGWVRGDVTDRLTVVKLPKFRALSREPAPCARSVARACELFAQARFYPR